MLSAYVFSLVELPRVLTSVVIRLLIFDSRHASALAELSLLIWARPISIYMLMYSSCLRLEHQCYVHFPVRPVPWGGTRQPSSYYCGVGCFGGRVIHPVCVCVCVWIPLLLHFPGVCLAVFVAFRVLSIGARQRPR